MSAEQFADNIKNKNLDKDVKPIVIFIASSTPEKARDLQLIAEAKGYPIIFEDINKLLGAFHHADEVNGTYVGNTKGKLDSVIHHITAFRAGNKTAKGQDYKERIANYLNERGLKPGIQMYIAAEDGGVALPKKVWDKMNLDGVPAQVFEKISADSKHNEFTGPGSETAPVMSSMLGEYNMMNRIRDAVSSLGSDAGKIPMLQNCAFNMMRINEGATDDIISFEANTKNTLHFPSNNSLDKLFKENGGRIGNFLYAKPEKPLSGDGHKTIAELGKEGIAKYSVRAKIVDEIYKKIFADEIRAGYKPDYNHPHKYKVSNEVYRVGAFGAHNGETLFNKLKELKLEKGFEPYKVNDKLSSQDSYDILSHIEYTMANNDAFVLFPDMRKHKPQTRKEIGDAKLDELKKLYALSSLMVSKQLHARDSGKAIIIMNNDGSWNNAIAIHNNLSNIGMTKDFSVCIPSKLESGNDINIQSNSYYDVVGTPKGEKKATYEQAASAVAELLKQHRRGYNVRKRSKSEFLKGDIEKSPKNFDGYKVAMFCSASNENKYLNSAVKNISYNLSKDGYGIIYGGGDRYTMGAVLDGVMQRREELMISNGHEPLSLEEAKAKTYIAGYSTRQILKSETKNGTFSPNLNYARQNSDINYRMADMLDNSDVVVAAPGGAGTVQEWTAALILNHYRPKEEQKPIVFFNPKLNKEQTQVWNVALKAVLGKDDYELLTNESTSKIIQERQEKRSKELGIYVKTTEKDVLKCISELKENNKNKGVEKKLDFKNSNGYVAYVNGRPAHNELSVH
jgi:predicted Rossmann-fold nucleotide-binding protein